MQDIIKILLGIVFLILGVPIGNYLAKITRDEARIGRRWFLLIVSLSIIGTIVSLILKNDVLLFTFLFIAIVTSRSLKPKSKKNSNKERKKPRKKETKSKKSKK